MKVFVLAPDYDYDGMGEAEAAFSYQNSRAGLKKYFKETYPHIARDLRFDNFIDDLLREGYAKIGGWSPFRLTTLEMDNV